MLDGEMEKIRSFVEKHRNCVFIIIAIKKIKKCTSEDLI